MNTLKTKPIFKVYGLHTNPNIIDSDFMTHRKHKNSDTLYIFLNGVNLQGITTMKEKVTKQIYNCMSYKSFIKTVMNRMMVSNICLHSYKKFSSVLWLY